MTCPSLRSHAPFPKLELGLGPRATTPRELPACSICLERLREPISLACGHDFCIRCFSTHRVPGCEPPCCPECRKICKQKKGLRSLGEKMKLLPQRPMPPVLQVLGPGLTAGWGVQRSRGQIREERWLWRCSRMPEQGMESQAGHTPDVGPFWMLRGHFSPVQESCAVRAEPLLLVRINASGGLILRMGAINRCLKHPLARDTPVCLLAVLGEQHSGKSSLLDHLLRGLPGLVRAGLAGGWRGARQGSWAGYGAVWSPISRDLDEAADAPFSACRSLVVMEAGPEQEKGPCRGSDGVPMASAGAYGCGATPSC